jgi:hypothetical protein
MLELGGVPTEERFRKLTDAQWALIMHKHAEMKFEKQDEILSTIEYLAQMVSPAPKAVFDIVAARRKNVEKFKKEEADTDRNVLAEDGQKVIKRYSIDGEIVNTSFTDAIKEAIGESDNLDYALREIMGDDYSAKEVVYTVDKQNIEYLKKHEDVIAKMEKIIQQGHSKPLEEMKLEPDDLAALKDEGFDTVSF